MNNFGSLPDGAVVTYSGSSILLSEIGHCPVGSLVISRNTKVLIAVNSQTKISMSFRVAILIGFDFTISDAYKQTGLLVGGKLLLSMDCSMAVEEDVFGLKVSSPTNSEFRAIIGSQEVVEDQITIGSFRTDIDLYQGVFLIAKLRPRYAFDKRPDGCQPFMVSVFETNVLKTTMTFTIPSTDCQLIVRTGDLLARNFGEVVLKLQSTKANAEFEITVLPVQSDVQVGGKKMPKGQLFVLEDDEIILSASLRLEIHTARPIKKLLFEATVHRRMREP